MRTLLLILGYLITDSALSDPCEDPTVLEDTWRSTDCIKTECVVHEKWKCDKDLVQGWYRFKSSGGWEIPETEVPKDRCSTKHPGWLKGSHPTVGQGEVERTVCFTEKGNTHGKTLEIKIKNCTSYFVYELKPTPESNMAYCTVAGSALTDPCVNHTVLDQPWRSTDCSGTQCVGHEKWKCDEELVHGWYRFKSSGGWEIPETLVPEDRCSTKHPGWLKGAHPTVGQGELERTVCFTEDGNHCDENLDIKIKNCSSYFVYELKPAPGCDMAYCTVADSALTDPCVNHTVLAQTWRSTNCSGTQCYQEVKCDWDVAYGWYRFKSSGGWEIPETQVTHLHCSTHLSGWLNGPHPTVGDGEVERKVCFTGAGNHCEATVKIKIKNCTSYFVYELKPAYRCNMAYCTDPKTFPNQEPEEQSTREPANRFSSRPAWSASSDPDTSPTQEPAEQSIYKSADHTSTIPVVTTASEAIPTQEPEEQTSEKSTEKSSSVPAGSTASDSGKTTSPGSKGASTSEAECKLSEEGQSRPGVLKLSDEECEKVSAEVQVMYIGKNKLDTPAEKEAYLRQVQDMLKDHLPCKKLALQIHGEEADGAENEKGK